MQTRREFMRAAGAGLAGALLFSGCGAMGSRRGNSVALARPVNYTTRGAYQVGLASWYGREFAGRKTANGERFDPEELTAAHRKLPFNTKVRVTDLESGRHVTVRINDRGPFKSKRVIDVSRAAARELDMLTRGLARVRIDVISWPRRR